MFIGNTCVCFRNVNSAENVTWCNNFRIVYVLVLPTLPSFYFSSREVWVKYICAICILSFSNVISTIKGRSTTAENLQLHLLTLSSKLPPTNFGKCDNNCRVWLKKCKKILQKKKEIEKRNDCNKKEIGLLKPMKYCLLFYMFWHTKTTI